MTPRNIKVLYYLNFFIALRFFAAIQIIYFVTITHSYALGMSLFAIATISQAVLEIPTGIFSDKIGRKYTTVLGVLAAFCSVAFYAIGQNFTFLLIGALIEGLARALGSGNTEALMHDSLKEVGREKEFHKFYGKTSSMEQFSFGIAALVGGFIVTFSFPLALWLSAGMQFIAFLCSLFLKEPKVFTRGEENIYSHLSESVKEFIMNPKIRLLTLSKAISYSLSESSYQFSPAFIGLLWPLWAIGAMRTFTSFASSFSFYISERVFDKFSALKALTSSFIFNRIINIIAYAFPTIFSPALLASTSLTYGVSETAKNTLLQQEYTDKQRATMGSLDSLISSIGFAVVSIGVGYIADIVGPRDMLLSIQFVLFVVLIFYWRLFGHYKSVKLGNKE